MFTPAEIDAFLADRSPGAYARAVDRYLASPAYGERMAMDWLDLARYADTYGYQADFDRDMSPYRDWVIRAFNQNLPYDQFLTWQLAGDLLPGATREQRIATAFNRLHRQTNEGGSVEEEFRTEYVVDRVNTFGTAMLGLTVECARCHDHRFDPITQRDYYALFAFKEAGQASDHDVVIGRHVAHILCGGDGPPRTVTEQDILDLERQAFLSLLGTKETQARIEHMLKTGKPLRN